MADYKAEVHGQFAVGLEWSYGLHITSNQDRAALLTTWSNAWNSAWTDSTHGLQTLYPTTTEVNEYSIAQLNGIYEETFKVTLASTVAGTSTEDSLPFQEATLISLRSPASGGHGRGRFFLPAMIETAVNGDLVSDAAATRTKAAVLAVKAAIEADGSTVFVVDKGVPHPIPPNPVVPPGPKFVITDWKVSRKPSRQARRVRKVKAVYV